jgi:hypothetical protein
MYVTVTIVKQLVDKVLFVDSLYKWMDTWLIEWNTGQTNKDIGIWIQIPRGWLHVSGIRVLDTKNSVIERSIVLILSVKLILLNHFKSTF